MATSTQTVRLSAEEAEYFSKLTSEDDSFAALMLSHTEIRMSGRAITLSRATAESFRKYFTERLAKVGFNPNYEPNIEGRLLERLIDTFFLTLEDVDS